MSHWIAIIEAPAISNTVVGALTRALAAINLEYLQQHPHTPPLYASGVVYRREPIGQEIWRSIPGVLERGYGDCEDLACWRAAELVAAGDAGAAPVFLSQHAVGGGLLYHILVQHGDGTREDPSRRLGMKG